MSKFTCDVCGGIIKMQANRTGVCQKCGMEYDIEAIKAMASKDKYDNNETPNYSTSVSNTPSNEIDRKALLIYLNDVRTLESIIDQSNEKIRSLNDSLASYSEEITSLQDRKSRTNKPRKPQEPKMGQTDGGTIFGMILGTIILTVIGIWLTSIGLGIIGIPLILFMGIGCIIVIRDECRKPKNEYEYAMLDYNKELENYNNSVKAIQDIEDEIIVAKKNKEERANKIHPITNSLNDDIDDVKAMLKKAYSANIIPIPFRNIEGVYYLYDYISSSNQSLSEALMQANLEAIKNKMDQVIKIQAVGIIQQAQTNAKLDNIQNQNKQIISAAERTAVNSELTAQYSAITAINSEITKRILKRELAYQRADFWLK